jgi:hypothetical protein
MQKATRIRPKTPNGRDYTYSRQKRSVRRKQKRKLGEAEFDRGRVAGKYLDQDRRSGRPDDPHDRGKEANAK